MIIFPPIPTLPPSKRLFWKNVYFPGDLINITKLMEAESSIFKKFFDSGAIFEASPSSFLFATIAETPQWGCGKGQEVQGIFKLVLTTLLLHHDFLPCSHQSVWVFLASSCSCLLARNVFCVCMHMHGMMRLNGGQWARPQQKLLVLLHFFCYWRIMSPESLPQAIAISKGICTNLLIKKRFSNQWDREIIQDQPSLCQ